MNDIDLYRAFGLDRHAGSSELADRLGELLARTDPADTTLCEQLQTAQHILGSPERRTIYDQRLADPAGPPLDAQALHELAGLPGAPAAGLPAAGAPAAAGIAGLPAVPLLVGIIGVLVVALIAAVVGIAATGDSGADDVAQSPAGAQAQPEAQADPDGEAPAADEPPAAPAEATAPVPGAYAGAGGPRPASAEPLPTYISRSGRLASAHLLTPTGGIGCDFQTADSDGRQGLCGVVSMNNPDSPLGTENRAGSIEGRWIFPFADDRVDAPVDSSGTTGWMNQPANDGYQVPRAEYGKQYYFEDWVCASEQNGLTCWNTTTGSGVFLSNEKAERFDGPGGGTADSDDGAIVIGSAAPNSKGFGSVKPTMIHSGGSGSSTYAYDLTWSSWGGDRAEATGLGYYVEPGSPRATSPIEEDVPITVVAYEPGTCNGQRTYLKVAYYFHTKGETFDTGRTLNACWDR